MTNSKTETQKPVAPLSLVQVLEERSIDLANPKEVKAFMETLTLEENLSFFPLVANKLLVGGVYRQSSASNAKGHKVGTPDYAQAMREGFAVWERGFLTVAEETRHNNKVTKSGTSGRSLPFTQAEILTEMGQLLPTGSTDKAKAVRASYALIKDYRADKFAALLVAVVDNPQSLVNVAIANLASVANERAIAAQSKLMASVELI